MRELQQRIASASRRAKADHEGRLVATALQTAELVNVVGSLGAGSKWRPVKPIQYFEAWTGGRADKPVLTAEEHRAKMARITGEIKAREARKRAKREAETRTGNDAQG
jgi:hypothetical protein